MMAVAGKLCRVGVHETVVALRVDIEKRNRTVEHGGKKRSRALRQQWNACDQDVVKRKDANKMTLCLSAGRT